MDMNTTLLTLLFSAAVISVIYWLALVIKTSNEADSWAANYLNADGKRDLLKNYRQFAYKSVAVLLAWFAWLVPLGLHRVMMRRRYAWLHPVAFLFATLASNKFFFYTPANSELGRIFAEQGSTPHFSDFSHVWLLSFTFAWMLLVVYDAIMVFSWSVNPDDEVVVMSSDLAGYSGATRGGYSKPLGQVGVDHDQAAQ